MGKTFKHVDDTERRLVANMVEEGIPWSTIQKVTGRTPDTINSILSGKSPKTKGAPRKLKKKDLAKLLKVMEQMIKHANAQKEITLDMILTKAKLDVTGRTAREAIKKKGIRFNKLKEKPLLKPGDVEERLKWAKAHRKSTCKQWVTKPHAIIDNKSFQMTRCMSSREYAARRSVRGAYQVRGEQPRSWLIKPKESNKVKFPGVVVTAAVIKGKVRMFHYIDGRWTAKTATHMYEHHLLPALRKAYPRHKGKWTIIEDNDPTGYKCKAAVAVKKRLGIVTDSLPKRSPDLNVLDYSLWSEINKRCRKQESAFRKTKKESKQAFKERLKKTARSLPEELVKSAVGSMRRRCSKIVELKGEFFNE